MIKELPKTIAYLHALNELKSHRKGTRSGLHLAVGGAGAETVGGRVEGGRGEDGGRVEGGVSSSDPTYTVADGTKGSREISSHRINDSESWIEASNGDTWLNADNDTEVASVDAMGEAAKKWGFSSTRDYIADFWKANKKSIAVEVARSVGNYVRKIGGGFGYEGEVPLAKGKRCFSVNGFSLHANTAINTHARDGLYKLIEYIARGPLSNERLEILES